ncbi:MAG: hypothetical protein K0R34_2642 [Herbinix sp.]|jgi:cell wall-associated NlpC family hydrolase/SH3-like domain-containing protein|nr:hypothetical protein [Herbinix sp.]
MKKTHKILTFCAVGTLVFASQSSIAKAEEIPVAGINLVLHNYFQVEENDTDNIIDYLNELNQYEGISFARVTDYVNIRSLPSEEGVILGKLYNNFAATIVEKSDDWYKVKSGSVTGYIKGEFLITGEQAENLAKEIGKRVAHVTTDTLKVREEPSTESQVLTLVAIGDEFIVKEEKNGWVKIVFEGDKTGYVSADYVELSYEYEEAVSIEEEQERLAAEQEAEEAEQVRQAMEQEAIRAEQSRTQTQNSTRNNSTNNNSNKNTSANTSTSTKAAGTSSSTRNKIVEYALRFQGNPYVWGGTSLTNGADCSGFTQSVFRDNGISIPRTSRTQALGGRRISIDEMQPGDLIFYAKDGTINHVGIYIGNGKIIAASSPKSGIKISSYNYRQPYRVVSYIND